MTDTVENVIMDVDPGLDDAWAMLAMLWAEKNVGGFRVRAVTCVNGNSTLDNVSKNALRVLQAAGRLDIPVFKGCSEPFIIHETVEKPPNFHFDDGFGNISFDSEPDLSLLQQKHAVQAIHDIIEEEGNVTLMCIGPLTNLAMLMKLYPGISERLNGLWIMGGNRLGVGNITRSAEYNFFCDPEAAHISFQSARCPVYLVPLETVRLMSPEISLDWRFKDVGKIDNRITRLLNPVEEKCWAGWNNTKWVAYDAIVAACYINRACMKTVADFHVTVELGGTHTRGQAVLDHRRKSQNRKNVTIIEEFDVEILKHIILETVKDAK